MIDAGRAAGRPASAGATGRALDEGGELDRVRHRARRDGHAAATAATSGGKRARPGPPLRRLRNHARLLQMRRARTRFIASAFPPTATVPRTRSAATGATIRTLLPYLWEYKARVVAGARRASSRAKLANVGVPLLLKQHRRQPRRRARAVLVRAARAARRLRRCCACRRRPSPSCANSCSPRSRSARCAASRCRCSAICTRCRCASISRGRPAASRATSSAARAASPALISFTLFSILPTLVEIGLVVGDPARALRLDVRRRSRPARSSLYIAFTVGDHRVAHALPPPDERARLEGQHARHRQPAQLRDGQVLRQRGIGGAPLRREPAALGEGGGARARPRCRRSTSGRARSSRSP